MTNNNKKKYNFSGLHTENMNEGQDKIELVSCEGINAKCTSIIASVNQGFYESEEHRKDKNFVQAIEALKRAYQPTFGFTEDTCVKCGDLFRSTIIESLENIIADLEKCSKGLFKRKDFSSTIKLAQEAISELKNQEK